MKKYTKADVLEQQLEDIVRRNPGLIEEGLVYVDHQRPAAGGRLDVLLVDIDKSLVVAELKVVPDDGMLVQGLDYYDDVSAHVESFARLYKAYSINPTQQVRLVLIAPSFSQTLVNRCRWLNLRISLFTFTCLKFEGDADVVPIFTEQQVATRPPIVEVPKIEDHLNYIADHAVRSLSMCLRHWPLCIYCRSPFPSVGFGGFIQTAFGGSAGRGARRTKRSGCCAYAAARMSRRRASTAAVSP